eukprot:Selendium_serpulae@DN5535_c0_g1_i5.p1
MSEWDGTVKEWLVDGGYCSAGGLANAEDGVVYAAAASEEEGDEGWSVLYKDDHEVPVAQEDGSEVNETINEASTIRSAAIEFKAPKGLWIGGTKYKVVKPQQAFDYNDVTVDVINCAKEKGGCVLVKTSGGSIVIAMFDENKEQTNSGCMGAALAFAEFMISSGY